MPLAVFPEREEDRRESAKTADANCELVVEGEQVKDIYYMKEGGRFFSSYAIQPGKSVFLPPESMMCFLSFKAVIVDADMNSCSFTPEVPTKLKVGTPLKGVHQRGSVMAVFCGWIVT